MNESETIVPTQITMDNFQEHLDKAVDISVAEYLQGYVQGDKNFLRGMNGRTFYFRTENYHGSEFWHWDYLGRNGYDCIVTLKHKEHE